MKLFLTVVLASVLMMKTAEGADKALGETCETGDTCPVTNADCVDVDGASICSCNTGYTRPTPTDPTCKTETGKECGAAAECAVNACNYKKCGKATGEDCTAITDCAAGACTNEKCGKKNGDDCTMNTDCLTFNCKYVDASSQKCADAGAAGVVASVLLMVATLITSRIL